MVKWIRFFVGLALIFAAFAPGLVLAVAGSGVAPTSPGSSPTVWNKTVNRVSDCGSEAHNGKQKTPVNCLFLEEPIGGRPNYDLFTVSCFQSDNKTRKPDGCEYKLWGGGSITPPARGPLQALLTFQSERMAEKGFYLFYNYVGLIYRYLSGIIVGIVVLFVIVGGIQMTTSGGDHGKFEEGQKRITKAILGMIIWFLASLILYTINPTFFAF